MVNRYKARFAIVEPEKIHSDRGRFRSNHPNKKMDELGSQLWAKACDAKAERESVEVMWKQWQQAYDGEVFVGVRNYYGPGGDDTDSIQRGAVNKIRHTVDTAAAYMQEMGFPENEKSWAIMPTPVPQLVAKAKRAGAGLVTSESRLPQNPAEMGLTPEDQAMGEQAMSEIDIARQAAEAKERIIEDYLEESDWKHEGRMAIDQGFQIGTGFLKGPMSHDSDHRRFTRGVLARDPQTGQSYIRPYDESQSPRVMFVDAWDVYPDTDARSIKECEFIFQRYDLSRNDLLRLLRAPGYIRREVMKALSEGWMEGDDVKSMRQRERRFNIGDRTSKEMFTMWEYTGSVLFEDYCVIADMLEDDLGKRFGKASADEVANEAKMMAESGLADINVIIRIVNGRVVSMSPTPCNFMPGQIYHAFTPFPTSGVFGVGLPDIQYGLQMKLNAIFEDYGRASRLGATCHIVMHSNVESVNGSDMSDPINIHFIGDDIQAQPNMKPFEVMQVPDLTGTRIEMVHEIERQMDNVSGMSNIMRGVSDKANETASGLNLKNNNAQNYIRRMVRMLDDDMIKPLVDSFSMYEEIYGTDESAKGDQKAVARGASVMFSRPYLAEAIPAMYQMYAADPDTMAIIDKRAIMSEHMKAIGIDPDVVLKSDERLKAEEAAIKQAQEEQGPPPEVQIENRKLDIAEKKIEVDATKVISSERTTMAKLEHDERKTAVEVAAEKPPRLNN